MLPTHSAVRRRSVLLGLMTTSLATFASSLNADEAAAVPQDARSLAMQLGISYSRLRGMVAGSLLGDALGGPIEFASGKGLPSQLARVRQWGDQKQWDQQQQRIWANQMTLRGYANLRPDPAPLGPWRTKAPAGTITDDSRHKMVLIRALSQLLAANQQSKRFTFDRRTLASEYLKPLRHINETKDTTASLDQAGFAPYREAARWWVSRGKSGLPPQRLWAGVANCSGQMALLPLSGVFAGSPTAAYRATAAIDFVDADHAVDFCAAINAGLAEAMSIKHDARSPRDRLERMSDAMRKTDPYRYTEIPYTGRPFEKWLDRARDWAQQADGRPKRLFRKLETEGEPKYYWDAHFTFVVAMSILQFSPDSPRAAMQLALDFGHDTDSYAQLLGAMLGAIHGDKAFPADMIHQVDQRLNVDYGETIDDWCATILRAAQAVQTNKLEFLR